MFGIKEVRCSKKLCEIPTKFILPNTNGTRTEFCEDELVKLADSIGKYGLLQPITVREIGENVYELIAGERRLKACKLLCMQSVPCIVCKTDEKTSFELSLAENMTRSELNMFEQAEAISKLMKASFMSAKEAADRLSLSENTVLSKLKLLQFMPYERQIINFAGLSEKHARALLRLSEPGDRMYVMQAVIENKLSASQTENYIKDYTESGSDKKQVKVLMKDTRLFVNTLERSVSLLRSSGIDVIYEKNESITGNLEFSIKIKNS